MSPPRRDGVIIDSTSHAYAFFKELSIMLGFATIRKDGFPDEWLDRERWRSLVGEFPELRRLEFLELASERIAVPDSAQLMENGEAVGAFIWENGQIYVDGPYSMFSLARDIADILDARVFDDTGDEMLQVPESTPFQTFEPLAFHHEYPEPLDLLGKDFISLLNQTKTKVATLVGVMRSKAEMPTRELPLEAITSMIGEIADEVHEWPNATLGPDFRHLVLLFFEERLVGIQWRFQRPSKPPPPPSEPWWRFW